MATEKKVSDRTGDGPITSLSHASLAISPRGQQPIRATLPFTICQLDVISQSRQPCNNSSMLTVGTSPETLVSTDHIKKRNGSYMRRTCSADALWQSLAEKENFYVSTNSPKLKMCRCIDELRRHTRSSSYSANDDSCGLRERMKSKWRTARPPSAARSAMRVSPGVLSPSPHVWCAAAGRHSGRHSVIGCSLSSPQSVDGGSPLGCLRKQRSSADSYAGELDTLAHHHYDTNSNLVDGRKCPLEFDSLSIDDRSSSHYCSPSPAAAAAATVIGCGKGCSPAHNRTAAFARDPPAHCERPVEVIHEDKAAAFFGPDTRGGHILRPSSNSAFCPLLPSKPAQ